MSYRGHVIFSSVSSAISVVVLLQSRWTVNKAVKEWVKNGVNRPVNKSVNDGVNA